MTDVLRKGIVLAGGSGTRLFPLTIATSKQLLPVYDKPLVYYPLSILLRIGVRDILLISTPEDRGSFEKLLGDGSRLGLRISYEVQPRPEGLAQAFVIGQQFIGDDAVALVLGDNILHAERIEECLGPVATAVSGATVLACEASSPESFGVVEFDNAGRVISIEEKPAHPKSNYVVPGFYFYDHQVVEIATALAPSPRGELEITDVHREYLRRGQLNVRVLDGDVTWMDVGTAESLRQATDFVHATQQQGTMVGCLEEIAWRRGYISAKQLRACATECNSDYGRYLASLAE